MGEALVAGLLAAGWAEPGELCVVELLAARRDELEKAHPGLQVLAGGMRAEGAVVAVKPGDVEAACRAIGAAGADRVLSIAAGVPLARLRARRDCSPSRAMAPKRCGRPSPRPAAPPPRACARSRRGGCAARSSRRSRPRPTGLASSGRGADSTFHIDHSGVQSSQAERGDST